MSDLSDNIRSAWEVFKNPTQKNVMDLRQKHKSIDYFFRNDPSNSTHEIISEIVDVYSCGLIEEIYKKSPDKLNIEFRTDARARMSLAAGVYSTIAISSIAAIEQTANYLIQPTAPQNNIPHEIFLPAIKTVAVTAGTVLAAGIYALLTGVIISAASNLYFELEKDVKNKYAKIKR